MKKHEKLPTDANEQLKDNDGYPKHPESEDIYNKFDKEFDIDPENIAKNKIPVQINNTNTKLTDNFPNEYVIGSDLDIPGAELDDQQENIGSEDEENNFYSIGGDGHNDLEQDK